jgi:ABC-type multidrug transport system fused ATPase/permease subunit
VSSTKLKLSILIIFLGYCALSLILVIIFIQLLSKFSLDRERPINLFLTLKKQVFENLKSSAENFSNKILNQFFGNEDNEDESQQDYQSNIQSKDINIIKFKTLNENYFSIKKAFTFMNTIIIVLIFIVINFVYFNNIYFTFGTRLDSIYNFLLLFDKNNLSQTHFILSLDIFKSYLFNKSIPILNQTNMKEIFYETFMDITDKFEDIIILTSKTNSFLSGEYLEKYIKYLEGDFSELLDESNYFEENKELLERKMRNGIKPIKMRVFEIINYLIIKYCKSDNILNEDNNISFILKEREFKL